MSLYRVAVTMAFGLIAFGAKVSHADFVLSFDPSQLEVQATGGVVHQTVDLLITHDGVGSNLLTQYEMFLSPTNRALQLVSGPVLGSDYVFSDGHVVSGNSPGPWILSGSNNNIDNLITSSESLLATIRFSIDTAAFPSGQLAINPSLDSAFRSGGVDVTGQFTINAASFSVTAVPEPSSILLVSCIAGIGILLRNRRRWR